MIMTEFRKQPFRCCHRRFFLKIPTLFLFIYLFYFEKSFLPLTALCAEVTIEKSALFS